MLIFNMTSTMLTELVPRRPSAPIAVSNLVRNSLACAGAIFTAPAIEGIGNGWLFVVFGLVSLVSGIAVLGLMTKYSEMWKEAMMKKMIAKAQAHAKAPALAKSQSASMPQKAK
jgi:hypothetical protein